MAERIDYQGPKYGIAQVPQVHISTGQAQGLMGMADTFMKLGQFASDKADRVAVAQGRQEGLLAGAAGAPKLKDDSTLYGSAFNQAALDTYTNQVELGARNKLDELRTKFAADPEGFQKASEGYMTGILGEVGQVNPALVPLMKLKFQAESQSALRHVMSNFVGIKRDEAKATALTLKDRIMRDVDGTAGDLFSGDPTRATGWLGRAAGEWGRMEAIHAQVGPDGLPLFSREDQAKAKIEYWDRVYQSGLRAWFDAQPDKVAAFAALSTGRVTAKVNQIDQDGKPTGKVVEFAPAAEMTRHEWDKVVSYGRDQMGAYISALNRMDALEERSQRRAERVTGKAATDLLASGKLTVDWVKANRNAMSEGDYSTFLLAATGGGGRVNTTEAVLSLEGALEEGEDAATLAKRLFRERKITEGTMNDYIGRHERRNDKAGPASDYRQLSEMLDGFSGKGMVFNEYDPVLLQFPVIKGDFDRFWRTFPQATDPKTGQPYGRNPTYEEGRAYVFRLMRTKMDARRANLFEQAALGVQLPPAQFIVRDPMTQRVDGRGTADRLFANYPGVDRSQPGTWPDALKLDLAKLKAFEREVAKVDTILGNLDGAK